LGGLEIDEIYEIFGLTGGDGPSNMDEDKYA
jgi:hypothetical protein